MSGKSNQPTDPSPQVIVMTPRLERISSLKTEIANYERKVTECQELIADLRTQLAVEEATNENG